MPSHRAFVDCILATPGDWGPKLVYADWLEEEGETGPAEAIRVWHTIYPGLAACWQRNMKRKPLCLYAYGDCCKEGPCGTLAAVLQNRLIRDTFPLLNFMPVFKSIYDELGRNIAIAEMVSLCQYCWFKHHTSDRCVMNQLVIDDWGAVFRANNRQLLRLANLILRRKRPITRLARPHNHLWIQVELTYLAGIGFSVVSSPLTNPYAAGSLYHDRVLETKLIQAMDVDCFAENLRCPDPTEPYPYDDLHGALYASCVACRHKSWSKLTKVLKRRS